MLLVMCHSDGNRYAVDARQVVGVLPRGRLHRLPQSPDWLAGLLVWRGAALPVIDLTYLTENRACPDRLSNRIVVLETALGGVPRRFGLLTERVGLQEWSDASVGPALDGADATALGTLLLDQKGAFQLMEPSRLIPEDRRTLLFPAVARES